MKQKKVPLRMCLGCQEMKPKKELIRVVKSAENQISMDITGRKAGRGAYICRNAVCFEKARKGKRLQKAFQCAIPEDVFETLKKELEEMDGK